MIRKLREQGTYIKDIAAQVGCSVSTVRRAIRRNGPPPARRSGVRISKLEDFKATVDHLIQEEVWNVEVIYSVLREQGYRGGIGLVRNYVRPKRVLRKSRACVRFETSPGQQLQHDWGEIQTLVNGQLQKVYFAVNTLGFSRRFHAWACFSNDAEHTYESLLKSFEYFGGTPATVLVDNQKAAVISHPAKGKPVFNEGFLLFAQAYGFQPKACKPYRAQTKGKTERMVRYIKENFFQRYRQFESLAHLNQQLEQWLQSEADKRKPRALSEPVEDRFMRELPHLKALPAIRYDTNYREIRRVPIDCYIDVRTNRYSVPASLSGQTVSIRVSLDNQLRVYDAQEQLVAQHRLRESRNEWVRDPGHHQALYDDVKVETRDLSVYEQEVA